LVERIAPVLVFLVAVTVIAELADEAKVFDVAAREAAHLARGRVWRLWLLMVVLATGLTIVLSLDTCAVLLASNWSPPWSACSWSSASSPTAGWTPY
jgi:arsenical pump membrane protein